jgi:hypothetical protein
MCPHTTIYVSSYYYIYVLFLLYMCPDQRLHRLQRAVRTTSEVVLSSQPLRLCRGCAQFTTSEVVQRLCSRCLCASLVRLIPLFLFLFLSFSVSFSFLFFLLFSASCYYVYVLMLLYMFPHTTICVLILLYVSSYYYVYVLMLLACVLILLYMCPHTTATTCVLILLLYMCPHTTTAAAFYYMCPHTSAIHVSSYNTYYIHRLCSRPSASPHRSAAACYYMCPHTTAIPVSSY